ncbi:MAG: hypothetical protein Q9157_004496 [Trypethelium eluteriae]
MAADAPNNPFVKQLASSDKDKRDAALESLRTYISKRINFDELELLKLWKGLFFCMWMSDKPKPQQQLARDLAELVQILPPQNVVPFMHAFWKTMAREWVGIDALRMNKFLYLIRQYFLAALSFFAKRDWRDRDLLGEYLEVLATIPLNPTSGKIPNGLRYHVLDIYVDEMDKVDAKRERMLPIEDLLGPVKELGVQSPTKAIREAVKDTLRDERLVIWRGKAGSPGEMQDDIQRDYDHA